MGDVSNVAAAAPANAIPPALIAKLVLGGVVVAAAVVAGYFLMQTPAPVPAPVPSPPKYSPPTPLPSFPLPAPAPAAAAGQPVQALSTPLKDLCHVCKDSWCHCHRNKQHSRHTQQRQCNRCPSPRWPVQLLHRLRRLRPHRLQRLRPLRRLRPLPHRLRLPHPLRLPLSHRLRLPRPLRCLRPHRPQPRHGQIPSMWLITDVGSTPILMAPETTVCLVYLTYMAGIGRVVSTKQPRQDGT